MSELDLVVDDAKMAALLVRAEGVEAFGDEPCMTIVSGEDDGPSELVSVVDREPVLHQVLQHLIHCAGIQDPVVDFVRLGEIGQLLAAEILMANALAEELDENRHVF